MRGYGKCYQFVEDAWQEFAMLNKTRSFAAGIIYDKKFHIFGGNDGSEKMSTEILVLYWKKEITMLQQLLSTK